MMGDAGECFTYSPDLRLNSKINILKKRIKRTALQKIERMTARELIKIIKVYSPETAKYSKLTSDY